MVSAAAHSKLYGKQVACVGDAVSCPKPGHSNCVIAEGDPAWSIDGRAVALEGHLTSCGAVLISTLAQVQRSHESMVAPSPLAASSRDLLTDKQQTSGYGKRIQLVNSETGEPLKNRSYLAYIAGQQQTGKTDDDGFADIDGHESDEIEFHLVFESPKGALTYREER